MATYLVSKIYPSGYDDAVGVEAESYTTERGELIFFGGEGRRVSTFASGRWDSVTLIDVMVSDKEIGRLLGEGENEAN